MVKQTELAHELAVIQEDSRVAKLGNVIPITNHILNEIEEPKDDLSIL